jgi:hypothetical protein
MLELEIGGNNMEEKLIVLKEFLYIINKILDEEEAIRKQKRLDYLNSYGYLFSKEHRDEMKKW